MCQDSSIWQERYLPSCRTGRFTELGILLCARLLRCSARQGTFRPSCSYKFLTYQGPRTVSVDSSDSIVVTGPARMLVILGEILLQPRIICFYLNGRAPDQRSGGPSSNPGSGSNFSLEIKFLHTQYAKRISQFQQFFIKQLIVQLKPVQPMFLETITNTQIYLQLCNSSDDDNMIQSNIQRGQMLMGFLILNYYKDR